jgi:iron complex outermembrane receptor protein
MAQTGFRIDGVQRNSDWTVLGDVYSGLLGIRGREDAKVLGGNVLGRWTKTLSATSFLQVQAYLERNYRRVPLQSDFNQHTFNLDVQHQFVHRNHSIVWGADYGWNNDETRDTPVLFFTPAERTYPLWTAFAQDEITLAGGDVRLTLGSKFEHNDFSGFEYEPSVRANFRIQSTHNVWAAVSRAVRTPTRFDTDIRFSPPGVEFVGNPDFDSEKLIAYEAGYRASPHPRLTVDGAAFLNVYDDIRSLEFGAPPPPGRIDILNNMNARTYGTEIALTIDVLERLRLSNGYTYLHKRLTMDPGRTDVFSGALEGNDPKHQFFIRQTADLPRRLQVDSTLRFVAALPTPPVSHYFELDARFGWAPSDSIELSIVGQNLLDARHPEFNAPSPLRAEVTRNIYGRVALRF